MLLRWLKFQKNSKILDFKRQINHQNSERTSILRTMELQMMTELEKESIQGKSQKTHK